MRIDESEKALQYRLNIEAGRGARLPQNVLTAVERLGLVECCMKPFSAATEAID